MSGGGGGDGGGGRSGRWVVTVAVVAAAAAAGVKGGMSWSGIWLHFSAGGAELVSEG